MEKRFLVNAWNGNKQVANEKFATNIYNNEIEFSDGSWTEYTEIDIIWSDED